jgi:hypothetical protein
MDKAEKKKDDAKAELDEAKQRVKQLGAISADAAALAKAEAAVERLQTIYAALLTSFNNATELVTKRKFKSVYSSLTACARRE